MAKPEYLDYSRTPPSVDGVPITRIQRIDAPLDLAIEKTKELGNEGVVQNVRGIPSFSVTIDENFIGSLDNLALFTNKMVPYQLNSQALSGDSRSGRFADTITTSNSVTRGGTGKINHNDIKTAYCDLMYPVGDPVNDAIIRTAYFHRLALTGFSANFDVNDMVTFSYTFAGSQGYKFVNDWDSMKCYVLKNCETGTFSPDGTAQSFNIGDSAFPLNCTVQGIFFDRHTAFSNNDGDWTFWDNGITDNVHSFRLERLDSSIYKSTPWVNTSVPSNAEKTTILFTHGAHPAGEEDYGDIKFASTSGSMGGLTKEYINFYMYNSAYASKSTPSLAGTFERVQNFTFNVAPETEDKFQLGDRYPYATERRSPVDVNGTISLLASDIEALAVACGTALSNLNMVNDGMYQDSINFQIDVYNDRAKAEASRTCRIKISNCSLNGVTDGLSVDGSATLELGFESDNVYFDSTGVDPNS